MAAIIDYQKNIPGMGWAKSTVAPNTLNIQFKMHKTSREKLCAQLIAVGITEGIVMIFGGDSQTLYDSDTEITFR